MYGSGVAIGMVITPQTHSVILMVHRLVAIACCVGVAGAAMRRAVVSRIASAVLLRTATAIAASAWFASRSLRRVHLQMASRSKGKDLRVMQMAEKIIDIAGVSAMSIEKFMELSA